MKAATTHSGNVMTTGEKFALWPWFVHRTRGPWSRRLGKLGIGFFVLKGALWVAWLIVAFYFK
jgi:hypothetical protein